MHRLGLYLGRLPGFDKGGFDRRELVELVRAAWQAGRRKEAIRAVTDEMVDRIAICGNLETCRARLDELAASGATLPLAALPAEGDTAEKIRALEELIR